MATTKIWPVKTDLGRVVRYAENPDKTSGGDVMTSVLGYATEVEKTEQMLFVTGVNCNPETAKEEMMLTKQSWNRLEPGRAVAFHGIQSFAPGEVTPEQAHRVGTEFARQMWGERFQVVVATHLDKAHLHNHFVLNSISFVDGKRYYDNKESYYGKIRKLSDALCREYGLSVVEKTQGKGKHYAEWKAEKQGKPTIRSQIRDEIDAIIKMAFTFQTFVEELRRRGYSVKHGDNVAHMAVKPKGGQRYIRLHSLGENYTEEAIRRRIREQQYGMERPAGKKRGYRPPRPHKKLKGFIALYYRYLYMLGKIQKRKPPKKAVFLLRKEVTKLEQYRKQFLYLYTHKLEDKDAVAAKLHYLEKEIAQLTEKRKPLYLRRRDAKNEAKRAALSEQIKAIGAHLRELRKEKRLCEAILDTASHVEKALNEAERLEAEVQNKDKQKQPGKFRLR